MNKKFICIIICMLCFKSNNVISATANGNASAIIIEAGGIVSTVDMNFGIIIKPTGQSGNISLDTSNFVTCENHYAGWICTGNPVSGQFEVYGSNTDHSIEYTDGVLSDGSHVIPLSISGPSSVTISNGTALLSVGGTLTIANDTPDGNYSTSNAGGRPYIVTVSF